MPPVQAAASGSHMREYARAQGEPARQPESAQAGEKSGAVAGKTPRPLRPLAEPNPSGRAPGSKEKSIGKPYLEAPEKLNAQALSLVLLSILGKMNMLEAQSEGIRLQNEQDNSTHAKQLKARLHKDLSPDPISHLVKTYSDLAQDAQDMSHMSKNDKHGVGGRNLAGGIIRVLDTALAVIEQGGKLPDHLAHGAYQPSKQETELTDHYMKSQGLDRDHAANTARVTISWMYFKSAMSFTVNGSVLRNFCAKFVGRLAEKKALIGILSAKLGILFAQNTDMSARASTSEPQLRESNLEITAAEMKKMFELLEKNMNLVKNIVSQTIAALLANMSIVSNSIELALALALGGGSAEAVASHKKNYA